MSEVTPIKKTEQLAFDGFPVAETAFKLTGTTKLYTERILAPATNVRGTFDGRVKGHAIDYDTGRLVNVIEVLNAELDD